MKKLLPGLLLLLLFSNCRQTPVTGDSDVVARVGSRTLMRSEVASVVPRGTSSADSLLYAESYVKRWITDILVYTVAEDNLGDEKETIDRLVDDYRRSLIRYRYQEKMVQERLSADLKETELREYYETNKSKFVLDKTLIKGLFLKIPVNAPGLADVKKWYKSQSSASLENIEKYSVQNASIYDYFYDRWVDFDEVLNNIPVYLTSPSLYLKTNKQIEETDSSYCYLLNISDYIPDGSLAPYEYVVPQIKEMLINQRKVDFIKSFEEELYEKAVRNGKVTFYGKQ